MVVAEVVSGGGYGGGFRGGYEEVDIAAATGTDFAVTVTAAFTADSDLPMVIQGTATDIPITLRLLRWRVLPVWWLLPYVGYYPYVGGYYPYYGGSFFVGGGGWSAVSGRNLTR